MFRQLLKIWDFYDFIRTSLDQDQNNYGEEIKKATMKIQRQSTQEHKMQEQ